MTHPQQPGQPNQPSYGYPQQPTQPYGQQPYPPQGYYTPPPPPKRDKGKIIGFSVIGVIAVIVVISVIGAAVGGGSDEDNGTSDTANNAPADPKQEQPGGKAEDKPEPAEDKPEPKEEPEPADDTAVFKVWGEAPDGVNVTYGSDSDTRDGTWKGKFEAELPVNGDDDMFFNVFAQLNGSGDIYCSVTIGGETDEAHASGSYNICDAQLSSDFTGGWTG
ncbi:hypothetical protein [Streptomyces sp. MAR4 CNX-425]|uniref:hypothetical protein n=1 Tax=Streptomyces sp. MAR4 CNX-425 TaxID=3406343 RepID=UPI003B510A7A